MLLLCRRARTRGPVWRSCRDRRRDRTRAMGSLRNDFGQHLQIWSRERVNERQFRLLRVKVTQQERERERHSLAKAMFGCAFSTDHASLHGTVSTVRTRRERCAAIRSAFRPRAVRQTRKRKRASPPGSTLRGSNTVSELLGPPPLAVEAGVDEAGRHVREPHSSGSPQHGRSVRDSKRAASSASITAGAGGATANEGASGGGVGIRPLGVEVAQLPGQLAHGVEHTVAARVVQNAFPNLTSFRTARIDQLGVNENAGAEENKGGGVALTDRRNKRGNSKGLRCRELSRQRRRPFQTLTCFGPADRSSTRSRLWLGSSRVESARPARTSFRSQRGRLRRRPTVEARQRSRV